MAHQQLSPLATAFQAFIRSMVEIDYGHHRKGKLVAQGSVLRWTRKYLEIEALQHDTTTTNEQKAAALKQLEQDLGPVAEELGLPWQILVASMGKYCGSLGGDGKYKEAYSSLAGEEEGRKDLAVLMELDEKFFVVAAYEEEEKKQEMLRAVGEKRRALLPGFVKKERSREEFLVEEGFCKPEEKEKMVVVEEKSAPKKLGLLDYGVDRKMSAAVLCFGILLIIIGLLGQYLA